MWMNLQEGSAENLISQNIIDGLQADPAVVVERCDFQIVISCHLAMRIFGEIWVCDKTYYYLIILHSHDIICSCYMISLWWYLMSPSLVGPFITGEAAKVRLGHVPGGNGSASRSVMVMRNDHRITSRYTWENT